MDFITQIDLNVDKKSWMDNLKRIGSSTTYQIPSWLEIYKNSLNSIPLYITVKKWYHFSLVVMDTSSFIKHQHP